MSHALSELCNARVGQLLKGKWKLERVLGIGGMAAVYEGTHRIGRKDAIKILHPEVARQPDLKRRFELEASAPNRFRHTGAVEIRDFDISEDGCPFLVMEMLDGESLGERVRRTGEISERDLLRIVDQVLDVLVAAHREGIVHRDIKLDNVFITTADEVKVLDFGVARILSGPVLTMAGTRLGTPAYMPPEQLRGLEVDGRADLYAVGATMFRLLTKRRIHEAPTEGQLILKMSTEPAPKTRTVEPSVSENVALVIDRALAFQAAARYPDAATMQDDVRHVIAGRSPPFAVSRAHSDRASLPNADRPTVAPPPKPAFASDPTSATVHHGALAFASAPTGVAPQADPASIGATVPAMGMSPTGITAIGATAPVSVRVDPRGADPSAATMHEIAATRRSAIASTVPSEPIALAAPAPAVSFIGAPADPSRRRAIASTAPMGPNGPMGPETSSSFVVGATRPATTRPARGSLVPIYAVSGVTVLVAILGIVLYFRVSANEGATNERDASEGAAPSTTTSAEATASSSSVTTSPPRTAPTTTEVGVPTSSSSAPDRSSDRVEPSSAPPVVVTALPLPTIPPPIPPPPPPKPGKGHGPPGKKH